VRLDKVPVQQIPPEQAQQLRVLVKSLEDAMVNGVSPVMMAQTIAQMAPREQLLPFTGTSIEQLIAEVAQVAPESQLATYGGRKFLGSLQQTLKQIIG
jgi:hypothetical protein